MRTAGLSPIWTVVFLAPTFVQRLFIGGEAVFYDEFAGVSLTALGYLCHLAVVLRHAAGPVAQAHSRYVMQRWMLIAALSAVHALMLAIEQPPGTEWGLVAIGRQLLWLFSCLAMAGLTTPEELLRRLVQFTHATFAVVVLTYLLYQLSGFPLQILLSNGEPRAQGLLSEPSGIGCLVAGYAGLAAWQGRWRRLAAAAVVVFMAYSVIGMIGFAIGLVSGLARRHVAGPAARRAIAVALLCLMPLALVGIPMLAQPISEAARGALQAVPGSGLEDNVLYRGFGERVLQAASLLEVGIEMVAGGENVSEGGLFRFTSVLLLLDQLQQSHHLWVGYGMGAHAQLMLESMDTILDFGLFPLMLSSFGLLGAVLLFGWLVATLSRSDDALAAYAVPFAVISCVNSAGGIHMYSVVLVAAFLLDRTHRRHPAAWPRTLSLRQSGGTN